MRNRDSESNPEVTEAAIDDAFSSRREERNACKQEVGCEPSKSIENGERVPETLTSRSLDRAIGSCVIEFNSADVDPCALAGGRRRSIDYCNAREPP